MKFKQKNKEEETLKQILGSTKITNKEKIKNHQN